jgi:aspartyl-tRNA(Asn)/glutamyl-tRNA(Gln) amidotransferase subunit A
MALCWTLDKIGPMARSAEDCGSILAAIAGHDPRDPSSLPDRFTFQPEAPALRRFRLGVLPRHHEVTATEGRFGAALEVLRALGHTTEEITLPAFPYDRAAGTIVTAEGSSAFEQLIRGPRLAELADARQQAGLLAGLATPATDYLRALRVRALAAPAAVAVFERCDVLVAPTLLHGASPIDRSIQEGEEDPGNGGPGNLLGWPSISIPMGFDDDSLPLGLELIGPPDGEAMLLALAMAFQEATDWHRLTPPADAALSRTAP